MVKIDATKLATQLRQVQQQIQSKLENAVEQWAVQVVSDMADLTPLGDDSTPQKQAQYQARAARSGLIPIPGLAEGSTQVSLSPNLEDGQRTGADAAIAKAKSSIKGYKLGQTIYIGNSAPYFMELEDGWSPQAPFGIIKPTVQQVKVLYGTYFSNFYKSY